MSLTFCSLELYVVRHKLLLMGKCNLFALFAIKGPEIIKTAFCFEALVHEFSSCALTRTDISGDDKNDLFLCKSFRLPVSCRAAITLHDNLRTHTM